MTWIQIQIRIIINGSYALHYNQLSMQGQAENCLEAGILGRLYLRNPWSQKPEILDLMFS